MVGHLLHSAYGCDIGKKKSLLHGTSICLRFSPGQFLISDKLNFCLFQLCLLMRLPSLGSKPYQAHNLSVCCVFACSCTVLPF